MLQEITNQRPPLLLFLLRPAMHALLPSIKSWRVWFEFGIFGGSDLTAKVVGLDLQGELKGF